MKAKDIIQANKRKTLRELTQEELKDFEIMFSNEVVLSFEEIFDIINQIILETGVLNGPNIVFVLKKAILLKNQLKVQNSNSKNRKRISGGAK